MIRNENPSIWNLELKSFKYIVAFSDTIFLVLNSCLSDKDMRENEYEGIVIATYRNIAAETKKQVRTMFFVW